MPSSVRIMEGKRARTAAMSKLMKEHRMAKVGW
jgi:hypothetical protein